MDFEKLYSKLPEFIKYNPNVLDFFLKVSKKIINLNKRSDVSKSQKKLIDLGVSSYDGEATGTLRDMQLLYIELMRFIDNVCNKYDIDYWITGGTLLGAVRHGGFIPWDDDIDISLMREDYEKFIEVLPKEISKRDYLKQECSISLLRDNHEDIFKEFNSVYDFEGNTDLVDSAKFMFLQVGWLKPYIKIDCFPEDYVLEEKIDSFSKNYLSTKYKFNQDVKSGKKRFDEEMNIKNKELGFTANKTKYFNDGLDTLQLYPLSLRKTDETFPLNKIKFDKYEFKCPKNNDYFLNVLFGPTYMQLPEIIETHNGIPFIKSQFNSKEEMDDKFKKDIEYLREINDNFE